MSSMFVNQGNVMQRQLVWNGSVMRVPSASMAVFNTVSIIVLVGEVEVWMWKLLCYRSWRTSFTLCGEHYARINCSPSSQQRPHGLSRQLIALQCNTAPIVTDASLQQPPYCLPTLLSSCIS